VNNTFRVFSRAANTQHRVVGAAWSAERLLQDQGSFDVDRRLSRGRRHCCKSILTVSIKADAPEVVVSGKSSNSGSLYVFRCIVGNPTRRGPKMAKLTGPMFRCDSDDDHNPRDTMVHVTRL